MAAPERKRTAGIYARKLFNNVYNYTLLGGVATAALATGDWWLMVLGAGVEALYMLYAPDTEFMRKRIDKMLDDEDQAALQQHIEDTMQRMSSEDRQRCRLLLLKQAEIKRLAADNPAFSREMLNVELAKLSRLVTSFVELAGTGGKYLLYLDKEDIGEVERQRRQYEKENDKPNLSIIMRRLDRLKEIKEYVDKARSQMELIENSFALLADQIVSMQSPTAMSGQLDDLLDGVDAIRESARETEQFVQTVGGST